MSINKMWRVLKISQAGLLLLALGSKGCNGVTDNAWLGGGVAAGTVLAAQSPGQQIEQVYYLGCFDPREQLPPTVYRVTVRGQASAMSLMHFGSGWVPAQLIDSLNTSVEFDKATTRPTIVTGNGEQLSDIQTGRRLVLFGPEGFREAPKNHRLVIVMGASPEKFFSAIDSALGTISSVQQVQANADLNAKLMEALAQLRGEKDRLADLTGDVAAELPATKGGK